MCPKRSAISPSQRFHDSKREKRPGSVASSGAVKPPLIEDHLNSPSTPTSQFGANCQLQPTWPPRTPPRVLWSNGPNSAGKFSKPSVGPEATALPKPFVFLPQPYPPCTPT